MSSLRIVMTGATAGFGLMTAQSLMKAGHRIEIGARSPERVRPLVGEDALGLQLDLDRLQSVRDFAGNLPDGRSIDVLILNAGLQLSKPQTSRDGFERTFAVNHLAHFQLLQLLLPRLAESARVILTGSGTHDPAERLPITPPDHANADWLAFPERDPKLPKSAMKRVFRAYASSKLANIMTARELARRHPEFVSLSYDPGYVPGTGLSRESPAFLGWIASKIIPLTMKSDRTSSIDISADLLTGLATSPEYAQTNGAYWSVRGGKLLKLDPSVLAQQEEVCAKLWDDSTKLISSV